MNASVSELRTKELQQILKDNNLPVHYKRKMDLVKRVKDNLTNMTSDDEYSGKEGTQENIKMALENNVKAPTMAFSNQNIFNFKEIGDSLETFDGETSRDIHDWLIDFEESSIVFGWNDIQKHVYARKLLRGAAKLCIDSVTGINCFKNLKDVLLLEFSRQDSSVDIHRKLSERKKLENESYLQYMYAMRKIAMRASIDEKSLVIYIISGISDSFSNKSMLYDAENLSELKKKLESYERYTVNHKFINNTVNLDKRAYNNNNNKTQSNQKNDSKNKSRCMNCGSVSHGNHNCPNRSKGSRCFKCSEFGHMAKNCSSQQPSTSASAAERQVSNINTISVPSMHVKAYVNGYLNMALVDTGSEVTLMKRKAYEQLPSKPKIIKRIIPLTGLAQNLQFTEGYISIQVIVNELNFNINCHIVANHMIRDDMIIGNNLLENAEIIIRNGNVTLKKILEEYELAENSLENIEADVFVVEDESLHCLSKVGDINMRNNITEMIKLYKPDKPKSSNVKLSLILDDEKPVYQSPRRLSPIDKEQVRKQITQWLSDGIIRNSTSSYASPITIVRKKNGAIRLCIDYRKLNEKVVKDRYPLPLMEDVIENLYNASTFSSLDLKNGFFHVDIEESSRKYTAFVTPEGHYEFLKAPFGLCNSPAVFQRYIHNIFNDF